MAKVARLTLGYYTVCTAAAVALGIILVTVIEPGQGSPLSGGSVTSCHTPELKVGSRLAATALVQGMRWIQIRPRQSGQRTLSGDLVWGGAIAM